MGRGGARAPDYKPRPPPGPGRYANRSDMAQGTAAQGVHVPTGLPYGERAAVEAGMSAAPAPNYSRRAPIAPPGTQVVPASSVPPEEFTLADLFGRPTERPDEPVTTGLPFGVGPGPEIFGRPRVGEGDELRASIISMQRPEMPPHLRALGALMSLVADARDARTRRMLAQPLTPDDVDALLADDQTEDVETAFEPLAYGTMGQVEALPPTPPIAETISEGTEELPVAGEEDIGATP